MKDHFLIPNDVNSVRIDSLEEQLDDLKERLLALENKTHELEAEMLVKRKLSEAWLKNTAIAGGILTTIGALGTVYYFLINNIDTHLLNLVH